MIEDARARQRRHRRIGWAFAAAAVAAGALIAGMAGGGGGTGRPAHGQPSGSGSGAGPGHSGASRAFPGAPSTQPNGYGVETGACPLAPPNRYLPARSGCVTVRRADVNGDGRPDLILVYSRLSRQHPSGYVGGTPPSLRRNFVAEAAFLKVVFANGTSTSARLRARAAAIDAVAHVNDDPGREIFLEVGRLSSGATGAAYGYDKGRLVSAGVALGYGGDSAARAGFDCLPGKPPRLIQRTFALIGPTIYGWWRETKVTYLWRGPKLVQTSKRTLKRRGAVTANDTGIGHGCIAGVS
ncbi:MAG TPA: hypothetical protein VFJ77_08350 [Gaiellaceae bacterium]|nr:hypothetical protein [Gaiellaceae bacterium]